MGKKHYPAVIGLLLVLLTLWLQSTNTPAVGETRQRLEALVYDLRLAVTLPAAGVDPRIVIVDIDERSLRLEGQFPWPRDKLARLTDQLFEHGAAVVGFVPARMSSERSQRSAVGANCGCMTQPWLVTVTRTGTVQPGCLPNCTPAFQRRFVSVVPATHRHLARRAAASGLERRV